MYIVDPELREPPPDVDLPEELKADVSDNPFALGEPIVMPDLGSPTFAHDIQSVAKTVTNENVDQFLDGLGHLFGAGDQQRLAALFAAVATVFAERRRISLLVDRGLHLQIPIIKEAVCPKFCHLMLSLFSYRPDALTAEMISAISEIAVAIPGDSLTLFNLYVTFETRLPHIDLVYGAILRHSQSYIFLGFSAQLVRNLRAYQLTDPKFSAKFSNSVHLVFREALEMGDDQCKTILLNLVLKSPDFLPILSPVSMTRCLMDRDHYAQALDLCAKYPIPLDSDVITALLSNAQTVELASRTLIMRCGVQEEIAILTAGLAPMWVNAQLPTLKVTVDLMTTLLQFQRCRDILSGCDNLSLLFIRMIDSGISEFTTDIVRIVRQLTIRPEFVASCDRSGFLELYYRLALSRTETLMWIEVVALTDIFARAAYSPQYLVLIPPLRLMVPNLAWRAHAVSLLATLSLHAPVREALAEDGLPETIARFVDDKELGPYATCFLKCLSYPIQSP
jgi:hypothetical protein